MSKEMSVKEAVRLLNKLGVLDCRVLWTPKDYEEHLSSEEMGNIINLLKSQQAEIERLKAYEPKFKIGQEVWFKNHAKHIFSATIRSIATALVSPESIIMWSYDVEEFDDTSFEESELFATKEECEK